MVTLFTEDKHIRHQIAAVSPGRMVSPDRSRKTPKIVIAKAAQGAQAAQVAVLCRVPA